MRVQAAVYCSYTPKSWPYGCLYVSAHEYPAFALNCPGSSHAAVLTLILPHTRSTDISLPRRLRSKGRILVYPRNGTFKAPTTISTMLIPPLITAATQIPAAPSTTRHPSTPKPQPR
jgi:hypothetical protein